MISGLDLAQDPRPAAAALVRRGAAALRGPAGGAAEAPTIQSKARSRQIEKWIYVYILTYTHVSCI